jgi:signal transduction histidine kinase/ActR/RegA family two-component response regulator
MAQNLNSRLIRPQVATVLLLSWLANRGRKTANLRLHTKFLLSLVVVIAGLTFSTLLIVGHAAEEQVQKSVEQDTRNSVLTFQNLRAQRQLDLVRQAEMLATLPSVKALMASEDSTDIQSASEEVWRSGNADLFAISNWSGKIVALHTSTPGFPTSAAEEMFSHSRGIAEASGWWFGHGHLYQVATRPIDLGARGDNLHLGTVIVGREINSQVAREVGRIALCQVAFRYGDEPVVSSFSALDDRMISSELSHLPLSGKFEFENKRYLLSAVNLTPGLDPPLTLVILKPYDEALAFITRLNDRLLLLGFLAVFTGGALVFLISRSFTRPLEQFIKGVHALEQGNFSYPLAADSGDEVSQVTAAFQRMRTTLQQNEEQNQKLGNQLRHAQKMEAVGRLAGGVAHDFNNLLTVIKGHSDVLELKLGAHHPVQHSIAQVQKAADRAAALTRQLLAFSRMQVLQPQVLDLNSLIVDLNKMLPVLLGEEIEYNFLPAKTLGRVKADLSQIEQVIMNLAVNARDAMPRGGKLTINTQNVVLDEAYARTHPPAIPGSYVLIVVADTGHGMDEETKARIFEPFFTTKQVGKGTGLGLSTVYGVVKQSGGYIWVDSAPGQGTRFEVFLPQTDETAPAVRAKDGSLRCESGGGTVLLAEDEEAVRELAGEFLRAHGYTVISARDGLEALELAEQQHCAIDILVTDVVMPRMRGTELALRLKRARPAMKIVYMSGYLEHSSEEVFVENAERLQKPFSRDSLLLKISAAANQEESHQLQPI